jgi:hypothetical protein
MRDNLRGQIDMVAQDRMDGFRDSCREQLELLRSAQGFSGPLSRDQQEAVAQIAELRNKLSLMLADSKTRLAEQLARVGKGKTGLAGYSTGS